MQAKKRNYKCGTPSVLVRIFFCTPWSITHIRLKMVVKGCRCLGLLRQMQLCGTGADSDGDTNPGQTERRDDCRVWRRGGGASCTQTTSSLLTFLLFSAEIRVACRECEAGLPWWQYHLYSCPTSHSAQERKKDGGRSVPFLKKYEFWQLTEWTFKNFMYSVFILSFILHTQFIP
jgi:hypothetical protein